MMLTKDFGVAEMACGCGCAAKMSPTFMALLQTYRDRYGKPMRVSSGARCPDHNKAIGGSEHSRHIADDDKDADAADIGCIDAGERYALVKLAIDVGFKGIGIHKAFVHVDTRPIYKCWLY